ncbi:MAG: DUF4912 domain-containing protein [Planctomycetes bacterium]|nr:DUF4912 domain-containing protein [Planctomycetota bacterium]
MARDPAARESSLAALSRKELLEIAAKRDIKGRHRMPKLHLVSAILKEELPKTPAGQVAEQTLEPAAIRAGQIQQEAEQAKYMLGPTPPHEEFFPLEAELPQEYGHDRIALMVRDPYWVHAYWEITPETIDLANSELDGDHLNSVSILRIYDVSSGEALRRFDVELSGNATNWYINLGQPGGTFCVDIGILTPGNRFYTLARSNTVSMPPVGMSSVIDERWMSLQEDFERMYALSGGFEVGASSAEMQKMIEKRLEEEMASGALFSMMSPVYKRKERGFWFKVETELIVYGATEPDAAVTAQGKPVQLRPDGTFTLRFALPDGKQTIDLTAESADNKEERTITPEVEKKTYRPEPVLNE